MTMLELIKRIQESGKKLDNTEEGIRKAAQALGISRKDIEEAFENFKGFPLDEDDLLSIAGGTSQPPAWRTNPGVSGGSSMY